LRAGFLFGIKNMAKRVGELSVFQVALLLKDTATDKKSVKLTREEWRESQASQGRKITDEIITEALNLAEIEERSAFITSTDRSLRIAKTIETHEQRIQTLEDTVSKQISVLLKTVADLQSEVKALKKEVEGLLPLKQQIRDMTSRHADFRVTEDSNE
jgi:hypothetical protein